MPSWTLILIAAAVMGGIIILDAIGRCNRACASMLDEYERTLKDLQNAHQNIEPPDES